MSHNVAESSEPAPGSFTCPRRQVLVGAGVGAAAVGLLAACGGSSSSGSSGSSGSGSSGSSGGSGGIIALKDVPSDTAVSVQADGRNLLLTQSGGKLTALDATCTHQGCTVAPSGDHLACPCHGSMFTLTGQVTQGPAPTALGTVAVKVVGGEVVLA